MSKKLESDKAKQIYAQIARERQDLKYSIEDTAENISAIKETTAEVARNPLSLFLSEESLLRKASVSEVIKDKPLQTIAACFSAGLAAAYLVKKIKPDWKSLISQSAKFIAASEVADKVKVKLSDMSGEFIENLFSDGDSAQESPARTADDFNVLH